MADFSARREARRRKLLMSSEERLKKIKLLNDKVEVAEISNDADEANPVSAALSAQTPPPIPAHQTQSEDADGGDTEVSALPLEDPQEESSHQTDAKGNIGLITQISELQEMDHSTTEQIRESRSDHKELEKGLCIDEKSAMAVGALKTISGITEKSEDRHPTMLQDFVKSSNSPNDSSHSCSPTIHVHSQHRSNKIPNNAPQSKPHAIPASGNISAPSMVTAASSTTQAETPITNVTQESTPSAPTGPFLTMRELFVVLVAVLMRVMLAVHWLTSFSGQSIIIPFTALQVMFFFWSPQKQSAGGMMVKLLSFAAMMSNIPQASIKKFQLVLSMVNKFFEDLALYLFAFILTHGMVELLT